MGVCVSTEKVDPEEQKRRREAQIRNKWINEALEGDERKDRDTIKLLFLGAGESGKSTLLKQMVILHGAGFGKEEREQYVPLVHKNIINSMQVLCKQSEEMCVAEPKYAVADALEPAKRAIMELRYDDLLDGRLAQCVKDLWDDAGIQNTFAESASFQLNDNTEYFFDRIDDVIRPGYDPTTQDILRARIRTTGIVEHRFIIENNDFRMYDVGGQRNARKKWIHCFENVTSIIFVAAISGFNQVLYEDRTVNRLHEALNLFMDICNSRWFKKTSIILFLNKKDIFKTKIQKFPLTICFPDYSGENNYRAACKFIKEEFKARNQRPGKRIYTHFTCATDTSNIERVFNSVKHIILRSHLMEIGLLDTGTELVDKPGADEGSDDENKEDH